MQRVAHSITMVSNNVLAVSGLPQGRRQQSAFTHLL